MIVLSNCLTKVIDEGGLKLATSIVKRMKEKDKDVFVVSFEREFPQSDLHLPLNKFHISKQLISLLKKKKQPVLYIPFPAPTRSMMLRIFLLSLFARHGLRVMLIRQYPLDGFSKMLLQHSKAELVVFSKQAQEFYRGSVKNKVTYLKTGIDTQKFKPVSPQEAKELKKKYGFDCDKPLVLHVGHMKQGRNVKELMKISEDYQVLLVISTLSKERQDEQLKQQLLSRENLKIMADYIPNIEEIYQMADAYFFPVQQLGHCIDVPLSCLEAAACNKPVITTDYGEMKEFVGKNGFYLIQDFQGEMVNQLIDQAVSDTDLSIRESVLPYDWANGVNQLLS